MNKLFIGLLIVAAGAAVYFFLNKKKDDPTALVINKELIIGKWNTTAEQRVKDSVQPVYQYEFQQAGTVLHSLNDSATVDTTHYEWNKANELVWKQHATDSIGETFSVVLLTKDSLQMRSRDSVTTLFIKAK